MKTRRRSAGIGAELARQLARAWGPVAVVGGMLGVLLASGHATAPGRVFAVGLAVVVPVGIAAWVWSVGRSSHVTLLAALAVLAGVAVCVLAFGLPH